MLDRADIPHVHWQMDRADAAALTGAVVTDLADLDQCIRNAVETRPGSCPLSPERGCDLDAYRDRPMPVRPVFLAGEVRRCLERDVPRVEVDEVRPEVLAFERIRVAITWRPRDEVAAEFRTTVVDLG